MHSATRDSLDERFFQVFSRAKPRGGKTAPPARTPVIPEPRTIATSRRRQNSPVPSVDGGILDDDMNTGEGVGGATPEGSQDEEQDELADDSNERGAYGRNENSEEDAAEVVAGAFGK